MIEGLKPYGSYRPSGMPWLGNVPAHWRLVPNRALLRQRKVLVGARHCELRLLSLTKQGVIVRDVESGRGKFSSDMGTSQEVRAGDLVFCLFDVPETPRTVGLSRHEGMITGAYTVFECSEPMVAAYLELYYRAMDDRKLLSPLYSGLRNTIPPSRFLGVKSPLPPPDEQHEIVKFLGHADRKIRRYIRAKQKLIRVLEEQKQAIIQQAVTRGLNPNAPRKPSGVEWLGEIPAHWEVRRAKYLFREVDVRSEEGTEELLSVSHITGVTPRSQKNVTMFMAQTYAGSKLCERGDLVINTMWAWMGALGVASQGGIVSPSYGVYRPRPESQMDANFVGMLLRSRLYVEEYMRVSTGIQSSRLRLYPEVFLRIPVILPPPEEQHSLAERVATDLYGLVQAQSMSRSEIELFQEYCTRLVADVVTGKVDIRQAAKQIPDQPDDLEPGEGEEDAQFDNEETEDGDPPEEEDAA